MGAGASTTNCEAMKLPIDRPEALTFVPVLEKSLKAMQEPHGLAPAQRRELRTALEKGSEMYESLILGAPHHRAELEKIKKEKMIGFQEIYAAVFKNKVKADPNFDKFLQVCDKISKQVQGQNIDQKCKNDVDGLIALYEEGAVPLLDEFTKLLEKTVEKTNGKFAEKINEQGTTEILKGSLKKLPRALEKIMFEPGCAKGDPRTCRDILRGMIIYKDMDSLLRGFEFIQNNSEWELVRVKNRFQTPTDGGWADCMINVKKRNDPTCHVAEIQLIHEMLYTARSGLNGHRDYHEYRCANELVANLNANSAQANGGNGTKTDKLLAHLERQHIEARAASKKDFKLLKELKRQIEGLKDLQAQFVSLKKKQAQLESDSEAAMNTENYDKAEEIDVELNTLNNEIKKYESFINLPEKWLEENGMQQNLMGQVNKENTLTQPNTVVKNELCKLTPKQRLDAYQARMEEIFQNPVEFSLDEAITRIEKNDHSLLNLDLSWKKIGAEGAKNLALALEKNSSLLNLNLSYNEIGAEGAKNLAIALGKNSSLLALNLDRNNIGDEGAKNLAIALGKNISLLDLDLWENNIGAEGAKNLALALEKNTSLLNLRLGENKIGDEGTKNLAIALEKNSSLLNLSLWSNNIGDEGAKNLAIALKKNSSLLILYLSRNNIGAEGAKNLALALEKNTSLLKLDLEKNNIGDEGAKNLALALEKNTSLLNLGLYNNEIEDEELKEKIKAALKRNKDRKN